VKPPDRDDDDEHVGPIVGLTPPPETGDDPEATAPTKVGPRRGGFAGMSDEKRRRISSEAGERSGYSERHRRFVPGAPETIEAARLGGRSKTTDERRAAALLGWRRRKERR
jgi:hypothetical protein